MPGKAATDGSGSKWTRMWVDQDLGNLNIRREQLAHIVHYKHAVHTMKELSRKLKRPIRIMNLGCGEANELRLFYAADHTKKTAVIEEYIGLEGDPSCVARTEKKAATVLKGTNARIEVCDLTKGKYPVENNSVDLVICNEVVEHMPREAVPVVLRGARRAMRRNGVFILSTPNKDGTSEKLPADHVYEWGYDEIRQAFDEAGFKVVDHMGVYIKQSKFKSFIRTNSPPETAAALEGLWDKYGLDIGSIMTANFARPVANNLIWVLEKKDKEVKTIKPKKSSKKNN